ncbi:Repulsive guidance molecule A, partial [Stegodyphus mimosarum]
MGPAGPTIIPIRILELLVFIHCWVVALSYSDCRSQFCNRQFERNMKDIVQGSNYPYCSILRSYSDCIRHTALSCRGDLQYHSVQSLIGQWTRTYNCVRVLERGPEAQPPVRVTGGGHRRPQKNHPECTSYHPAGGSPATYSHCALFGDPHLRTFYDELQTCGVAGAWPLLDNPHVAVQVTNEPVNKDSTATAITKVTVIIRQHSPCALEKMYEAQTDSLPSVFVDGSKTSGPGVKIVVVAASKHIEIHLRYIATKIIIRQVGHYLTFAAEMPSTVAVQGAQGETHELCVRGCPKRERIEFEGFLDFKSGSKREALAACRALNLTGFYLNACVFDIVTTGDSSFSTAARDAMFDGGQMLRNGSLPVIPRSVESEAAIANSYLLLQIMTVLTVLVVFQVKR